MMHPKGGRITEENAPRMLAMVNLTLKDGEQEIAIESHISYLTTVYEEPRCVIGIRFDNIDASMREVLDRYFMEQMSVYFAA